MCGRLPFHMPVLALILWLLVGALDDPVGVLVTLAVPDVAVQTHDEAVDDLELANRHTPKLDVRALPAVVLGNIIERPCTILHQVVRRGFQEILLSARGGGRLTQLLNEGGFVDVVAGGLETAAPPPLCSGGDRGCSAALRAEWGVRHKELFILECDVLPEAFQRPQYCMLGALAVVCGRHQRPCELTTAALPVRVLIHLHHELLERAHPRVEALPRKGPFQVPVVGDALLATGVMPKMVHRRRRGDGLGDKGVAGTELVDQCRPSGKGQHRLRHRQI
mmetsp:Transcript_12854/g.45553  ORF Transcript_12854/g.45553 Transcript_12854/m.45553 type:complete len:278 (+) Transcript_12854:1570-2403(+)